MTVRRQPNPNSESVDNYLKAILALGGPEENRVASNALAQRLGVAPASVTNMLQKLAAGLPPLVEYERHRGVLLSDAGKRRALEVVRHHRLIETFLYEVLNYPIEEVHEEAERLEHLSLIHICQSDAVLAFFSIELLTGQCQVLCWNQVCLLARRRLDSSVAISIQRSMSCLLYTSRCV